MDWSWTRFELLRLTTRAARTAQIAFRPVAYVQNRPAYPGWAPSKGFISNHAKMPTKRVTGPAELLPHRI